MHRARVRWDVADEGASAAAVARACARGRGVVVASSDGFARASTLWRVYDVVASVAPRGDVTPVFGVTSAVESERSGARGGGWGVDAGDATGEDVVAREARARAESWDSDATSTSYDFVRDGTRMRVSVGGTFDRLHAGHRLLLATAMRLVEPGGTLYVGVTSASLLGNKAHGELVEPYDVRAKSAREFLAMCDPTSSVEVRVGPLDDGPPLAATVRDMSALVVSRETIAGAEALNDMRVSAGFAPLDLVVVDLVGASASSTKLSSTTLRSRDASARRDAADRASDASNQRLDRE